LTSGFEENLELVAKQCELIETPCADGSMPFRVWHTQGETGLSGEVIVLLHGGSGSWTHWIRNIEVLSVYYEVVVPDLPGLGDSAHLPDGYQPQDAAGWVAKGVRQVLGRRRYHIVAFSWGCVMASFLAAIHKDQVKSQILIGPASMGEMPRRMLMKPLIPRTSSMTDDKVRHANKENLARLMIYNRDRIDNFAVYLQTENTRKARFRSPRFVTGTFVLDEQEKATAPLLVLYGEFDAAATPNISAREDKIRHIRPDAHFEVVPDCGHWLQYEVAELFNARCVAWIEENSLG
jgi:pimeloyl-ACP methyl ester carboxylesterase